jgi:hypothetical protein
MRTKDGRVSQYGSADRTDGRKSNMFTRTKITLAAAIVLATAPVALAASDHDESGGFVIEGSTVGVNPVYHQVLMIGSDGHVTTAAMPTDSRMLKMMDSHGHVVGRSLMLWRDDKGIHVCSSCGA